VRNDIPGIAIQSVDWLKAPGDGAVASSMVLALCCFGARMDLSVLNPLDPAQREGLIAAAFLLVEGPGLMPSGETAILLRLAIEQEPVISQPAP
jgi:hypothetical protein